MNRGGQQWHSMLGRGWLSRRLGCPRGNQDPERPWKRHDKSTARRCPSSSAAADMENELSRIRGMCQSFVRGHRVRSGANCRRKRRSRRLAQRLGFSPTQPNETRPTARRQRQTGKAKAGQGRHNASSCKASCGSTLAGGHAEFGEPSFMPWPPPRGTVRANCEATSKLGDATDRYHPRHGRATAF